VKSGCKILRGRRRHKCEIGIEMGMKEVTWDTLPWIFSGCEWNPLKFLFVGVNGTLISIKHKAFLQQ
jgi:hypothetical protein